MIFVFGSNLAGRHGAGAALHAARVRGAIYGQGEGFQSRWGNDAVASYAIPTKGHRLEVLPLDQIAQAVGRFLAFARSRPDLQFEVTPIGCGLAGYRPEQIAPMFRGEPDNVILPAVFCSVLGRSAP